MTTDIPNQAPPARIESLRVQNFRALRNIELKNLSPLTVLLGPNGSGKSTIFDIFAFLSECFESGLRNAWDKRGRAKELVTRGSDGPVVVEIKYKEQPKSPRITYHFAVAESQGIPIVEEERLEWRRGQQYGRPFRFLEYHRGQGGAVSGELPDKDDQRIDIPLYAPDTLAINALGQLANHPRVAALRKFITGWHVSSLSADSARSQPEAGPRERLSRSGDNLANVIQYLLERHPERLEHIFRVLGERVPHVEQVISDIMQDGRLLLQIKDAPFERPILARFASDGTIKMLAYLLLLHDPSPPPFIGIEEPENFLHPRLLYNLAEECRAASERVQLLVTTHSPQFLDALRPDEVWSLWRDNDSYTQARRASNIPRVREFMEAGASLGDLWMEGYFGNVENSDPQEQVIPRERAAPRFLGGGPFDGRIPQTCPPPTYPVSLRSRDTLFQQQIRHAQKARKPSSRLRALASRKLANHSGHRPRQRRLRRVEAPPRKICRASRPANTLIQQSRQLATR